MSDDNQESNSEGAKSKTIKPKARKPKPTVEGINSSKNTSDVIFVKPTLTEQEKRVIKESGDSSRPTPKLLSQKAVQRAGKKSSGLGAFLLWLIFFLLLGFAVYEVYGWYVQKHTPPAAVVDYSANNQYSQPQPSPTPPAPVNLATSTPPIASSTPVSTTTPTIVPAGGKQLLIKDTPTGYLNVRSTPSSSGALVTQAHPGEVYTYTNSKNGWYQIVLVEAAGKTGWVTGQYVTLQ